MNDEILKLSAEDGMRLFAFHGKLNEEFDGLEAGTWARDILKPKNNRYTFTDKVTRLKVTTSISHTQLVIH